VPPKPLPFETLHGGSSIRFLGSVYATARTFFVVFITGKLLLPGVIISYGMTREVGQGSGSSESMGGYDRFISLPFYVLQIIYVSCVHVYCFICKHEFITSVLSYHIMTCMMHVHASNMPYLFVLILQSCCLCCLLYLYDSYAFMFSCSIFSWIYLTS
jgi:hypothetical protein